MKGPPGQVEIDEAKTSMWDAGRESPLVWFQDHAAGTQAR